jgi:hypothetical protein
MTLGVIYKRHLAKLNIEKEIVSVLEEKVKSLPNYQELRLHPELILLCCNLIENSVSKKDKVQKKDLAVKVLGSVFNYSAADKKACEDAIEFLHSNKRIKKIKVWKKLFLYFHDWLQRKLL